ncbi:MAG: hypothetical protein HOL17_01445 [Gammaproteobacteria bacterium]|nr:hypothetical protein [Gammaproteobacteria bacterium]
MNIDSAELLHRASYGSGAARLFVQCRWSSWRANQRTTQSSKTYLRISLVLTDSFC